MRSLETPNRGAVPAHEERAPVLCGVNGHESRTAVRIAARLANALGTRLLLVRVVPSVEALPSGMASELHLMRQRAAEAAEHLIGEVADEAFEDRPNDALRRAELRVDFGDPVTRLAAAAEEVDARVIVVGARGRGPATAALLGSVSQRLASEQSRPVLIVPPDTQVNAHFAPPDEGGSSIVCGVDGSDGALHAARAAGWLASALDRRLILAHVVDAGTPSPAAVIDYEDLLDADTRPRLRLLERATNIARADEVEVEVRLLTGESSTALEELGEHESADLIVVGTRGHGALKALALGSVARGLACSASRPVLVVNDAAPPT